MVRRAASSATAAGAAATSSQGCAVPFGASGATRMNGRALPGCRAEPMPSKTSGTSASAVLRGAAACITTTGKRAFGSLAYCGGSQTRTLRGRPSGPRTADWSSSPPPGWPTLSKRLTTAGAVVAAAAAGSAATGGAACCRTADPAPAPSPAPVPAPAASTMGSARSGSWWPRPSPPKAPSAVSSVNALTHTPQTIAPAARTSIGQRSPASS